MNRQGKTLIDEGLRDYLNKELNINFSKICPHMGSNDMAL